MKKSNIYNNILGLTVLLSSSLSMAGERDLRFSSACLPGTKVTISAVGDVLLHTALQNQAYKSKNGAKTNWSEAIPYLKAADISYANLEGPVAAGISCSGREYSVNSQALVEGSGDCRKDSGLIYAGYPHFNYHPSVVQDILDSGIDVVSAANNHSMDRHSIGVDKTIDTLNGYRLAFSGIKKRSEQKSEWHVVTKSKGHKIAWLSCTENVNGRDDSYGQVLRCYNKSTTQIIKSLSQSYSTVIVTPHWGSEYTGSPDRSQTRYAKEWLNAGATAVLGSHPHVVQPWEKHITPDGRETLIVYSLGNFVSNQGPPNGQGHKFSPKQATPIVYLGLTFSNGKSWINGVRYAPAYMRNRQTSHKKLLVSSLGSERSKAAATREHLGKYFGHERASSSLEDLKTNKECR